MARSRMRPIDDRERADYERDGFLILRQVLDRVETAALAAAAKRYAEAAKDRPARNRLHLHEEHPHGDGAALLDALARPRIHGLSEALIGGPLMARYYCLNVEMPGRDTSMRWHRDSRFFHPPSARVTPVAWRAERPFSQSQWNLALLADPVLHVVPGSHRREHTAAEQPCLDDDAWRDGMPGAMTVALEPGDAVVYHCDILHGVRNPSGQPRLTVHWYWLRDGAHDPTAPGPQGQLAPAAFTRRLAPPLDTMAVEEPVVSARVAAT